MFSSVFEVKGRQGRGSSSTDSRPFLNLLNHGKHLSGSEMYPPKLFPRVHKSPMLFSGFKTKFHTSSLFRCFVHFVNYINPPGSDNTALLKRRSLPLNKDIAMLFSGCCQGQTKLSFSHPRVNNTPTNEQWRIQS